MTVTRVHHLDCHDRAGQDDAEQNQFGRRDTHPPTLNRAIAGMVSPPNRRVNTKTPDPTIEPTTIAVSVPTLTFLSASTAAGQDRRSMRTRASCGPFPEAAHRRCRIMRSRITQKQAGRGDVAVSLSDG